ncbi:SUB8 [[Candida] subhashii]|uniref:SUB8 n=1 Tax=[Candida] subhashii TaxID=561895 RepID=A0A8J5QMT8_9ASCO|nr:SUB8 [[Candida] subhashii]KAG7663127.1 SUB8 [[Candida] subhashii]
MLSLAIISLLTVYSAVSKALILPDIYSLPSTSSELSSGINNIEDRSPSNENKASLLETNTLDNILPFHYIVVYKQSTSKSKREEHEYWITREHQEMMSNYIRRDENEIAPKPLDFFGIGDTVRGYSGYFSNSLLQEILKNPEIDFVEHDAKINIQKFQIQNNATWGLARISQRLNFNNGYFLYDDQGGKGVTAYVVDTGIATTLAEFEGRASWGKSIANPELTTDVHGHGTHVAGILGSKTYGVAKQVKLVAVGVMNSHGGEYNSDIIKGIEYAAIQHKKDIQSKKKGFRGSVVNISIGEVLSNALDMAVNEATAEGLHVAVAAGNAGDDARKHSPARAS